MGAGRSCLERGISHDTCIDNYSLLGNYIQPTAKRAPYRQGNRTHRQCARAAATTQFDSASDRCHNRLGGGTDWPVRDTHAEQLKMSSKTRIPSKAQKMEEPMMDFKDQLEHYYKLIDEVDFSLRALLTLLIAKGVFTESEYLEISPVNTRTDYPHSPEKQRSR
jgi:hypothetical protein